MSYCHCLSTFNKRPSLSLAVCLNELSVNLSTLKRSAYKMQKYREMNSNFI